VFGRSDVGALATLTVEYERLLVPSPSAGPTPIATAPFP
jgi:hypothetical protein